LNPPDEFAQALAEAAPRLGAFGRNIQWYHTVTSTNDVAARLAEQGADAGVVIVADAQTAGRGRHGRTWASPAGAGLYVSTILRPPGEHVRLVPIAAGVAVAEGVEASTGLAPALKWPNDVYVGSRKLAGILAEGGTSPNGRAHAVLGFGINVLPAAYPPDVAARATSLETELGRRVDRGLVLACCLRALASRYADLCDGRVADVIAAWRGRAATTLGRQVEWTSEGAMQRGVAENIDADGALVVRTDGAVVRVSSGEVRWI
jgi:BirA family transcriptional regulator, biotin operon repressor / biotin---[acetyl-CoA-carboxylase] ligase